MKKLLYILFFFISSNAFTQATLNTGDGWHAAGSTNGTTLSSVSISVTSGDYYVAIVHGRVSSGSAAIPTPSGLNISSWQQVATVQYEGTLRRITAWVGVATSTSSTTFTSTWGANHHQRHVQVYKVTGAATTNNGLDGLAQAVTNTGSSTSASVTMAARKSNTAALATFSIMQATGTDPTMETPFLQLYTRYGPVSAFSQPLAKVFMYLNGGTGNVPTSNLDATYDWAGIALEFKPKTRRVISSN